MLEHAQRQGCSAKVLFIVWLLVSVPGSAIAGQGAVPSTDKPGWVWIGSCCWSTQKKALKTATPMLPEPVAEGNPRIILPYQFYLD